MTYQINSTSLKVTEELAAEIGNKLIGGEVIALRSDLGGGKTSFVRGLVRGAGSHDHVSSPTFALSKQYHARTITIYHFDFYRLVEPGIMALELAELLTEPQAVVVIEWGEIVESVLPDKRLLIEIIRTGDETRLIRYACPASLAYLLQLESK